MTLSYCQNTLTTYSQLATALALCGMQAPVQCQRPQAFSSSIRSCRRARLGCRATCSSSQQWSRRDLGAIAVSTAAALLLTPAAAEAGFKKELKKRKVPLGEYTLSDVDGLRFYDTEEGKGRLIQQGDTAVVHFDCMFRGIDAVSSRYARTLGGNRTIAEPFEFVVGQAVNASSKKSDGGTAGGLFAGGSGPKPPGALSTAVIGMKPGGKRIVYVDNPDLGYPKGNQEIPPGEPFELRVEVLSVTTASG